MVGQITSPLCSKDLQWLPISVQVSCSDVSNSLHPHWLQQTRLPCASPTPRACSNSCPSSRWCNPTISSSVVPFSSCVQSFPASGLFQTTSLFLPWEPHEQYAKASHFFQNKSPNLYSGLQWPITQKKRIENLHTHKNLYANVHSSI